ncbi:MAG: chloride channel protein [Inquilinus sp.]|nr:chloride channel protein [Inquilinus sp.]
MLRRPMPRLLLALRRVLHNDQLVLAVLAVVIGTASAAAAIGFRLLLGGIQFLGYGFSSERVATLASKLPWWQVLLVPAAGGLLIGLMLRYLMPGRAAQGVADVMEACALRGARMSLRTGIAAAAVSAASLGVGASTGREGPVVHLGASLGAWLARRLRLSAGLSRTLLGCGVAAAVAASFNAPIAGVFFALEVVIGHYALSAFAPIVLASVMGTVVTRLYYGDFPAFILPQTYDIVSFLEFPAFALLGLVSALVAILFMKSVIVAGQAVERTKLPLILRPAIGGLAVGALAIWFPEVLGVGYETTDAALKAALPIWLLFALIFIKAAATAISLASGFGGGVFSPSLFLGAMSGGAFGMLATRVLPELSSGHGAYTLVGMGAVAGAVLGAPISTILIVFEMTGDYELTIAVMVAVVIASVVTDQALGRSLFTWQLERRGVSLRGGREIGLLSQIRVADVMKRDYVEISPGCTLVEMQEFLRTARYGELFVVDDDHRLLGIVTIADLAHAPTPMEGETPTAGDLARRDPPILAADEEVRRAMRLMDSAGESHIPVVADHDSKRVVGFVHEHDVVLAYHRALLQARAEERGDSRAVGDPWQG